MFKRIRYWKTYRAIARVTRENDWETALTLAKRIGDDDLREWFALARITQLLYETGG